MTCGNVYNLLGNGFHKSCVCVLQDKQRQALSDLLRRLLDHIPLRFLVQIIEHIDCCYNGRRCDPSPMTQLYVHS